jgi:chromosome partitioning protein
MRIYGNAKIHKFASASNMMIISFVNQKGGAGKTTLSLCTAFELNKKNKVLIIDADPQGSIMDWASIRDKPLPVGLGIASMATKNIHRDLSNLVEGFEHVVIDTPGWTTDITRSAIMASTLVVIPCTPSAYDVWATKKTLDLIREATVYHSSLKFAFAVNRKIANTVFGREVNKAIRDLGDDLVVMKTEITHRMLYAESPGTGLAVQEMDREGKASQDISDFVKELFTLGDLNENV